MKSRDQSLIAGIVVGALIFALASGALSVTDEGVQYKTAGGTDDPTPAGLCAQDDQLTNVYMSQENKLSDPIAATSGNYSIFLDGSATVISSGNFAANGTTANDVVSCQIPEKYRVIFGDGFSNYHLKTDLITASGPIQRFSNKPYLQVGSATLELKNASGAWTTTTAITLGTGASTNRISMQLLEGTNDAFFGAPDQKYSFVSCALYNEYNFSRVGMEGGDFVPSVDSYTRCEGYKVPNNLKDWGTTGSIVIQIEVLPGVNPQINTTHSTNVSIRIYDWATYLKNGDIMYDIKNRDTGGTIGATDLTTADAIAIF